jgi:ATP-dependent DNA helicase RecG
MAKSAYPLFHPESRRPTPLTMSREDFKGAFPREGELVEFKEGLSQRQFQRVVTAFSNSSGGIVLIGVRDDGFVVGRTLTTALEAEVHRAIREINDPGRYWLHTLDVDAKNVVVVSVAQKAQGFAQTRDGQVLVRRGEDSVPLIGNELARFISGRALVRFDETETAASYDDIAKDLLEDVRTIYGWRASSVVDRLRDEAFIRTEGQTRLSVAGVLALTDDPAHYLGKTYVEILRFPDEGVDYDKRVEIRGPVQQQVAGTTAALMDELGTDLVVSGIRRLELPKIPEAVIREAVSNAVAHRSYEDHGRSIRVLVRRDRLEIESPGGLPEPVTVDNIREMNVARNIHVIKLLRRFNLAEDSGRGVDVMIDGMAEALLDPPEFVDLGHTVCVTLPIRGAITTQEKAWIFDVERGGAIRPQDRVLLVLAARGEALTNERVRELLGVDSRDARAALRRLRDAGFVEQFGERGGARYVLAERVGAPPAFRLSPKALRDMVLRLAADGAITNADVREATGLDRVEALRVLDSLVDEGRLERQGERRGARYVLGLTGDVRGAED